jgi:hypothetical protein
MCLDGGRLADRDTSGRRGAVFICGVLEFPKFTPYGQVCLPYLDPALIQSRQQILRSVYGFTCTCPSCIFVQEIGMVPEPPKTSTLRAKMERELRRYVFPDGPLRDLATIHQFNLKKESFPQALHPVLQEPYLADLSERFSLASHEGQAVVALETGLTLLALHVLIYPENYPQIGKGFHSFPMYLLSVKPNQVSIYSRWQRPHGMQRCLLGKVMRRILRCYEIARHIYHPAKESSQFSGKRETKLDHWTRFGHCRTFSRLQTIAIDRFVVSRNIDARPL